MLKKIIIAIAVLVSLQACTKIESGHSGARVGFNGQYDTQELGVGFHQNIVGDVKVFVTSEMAVTLDDLKPQTSDRTQLGDLDLVFNYHRRSLC